MTSKITEEQVRIVYRSVLRREPENAKTIAAFLEQNVSLEDLIRQAVNSDEFHQKYTKPENHLQKSLNYERFNGARFLNPEALQKTSNLPPRILLIGSCMFDWWGNVIEERDSEVHVDRLHIDMHPKVQPPMPWENYRYQIGQIPLRSLLPDQAYLSWIRAGYSDASVAEKIFVDSSNSLRAMLIRLCCWAEKLPMFVMNFLSPIGCINGRLVQKYDLRDNRYFIRELNRVLHESVAKISNVHVLDADDCAATFGRRYFQEDPIWMSNHGGLVTDSDIDHDRKRITEAIPYSLHQELNQREFISALYLECEALYRSLRGLDAVKMVCVDLDDTIWRGVLADVDQVDPVEATEGWPLGIIEALAILKRRGIILCLTSKNDEKNVRTIWNQVYEKKFPLSDFAILKINWHSKEDNVRQAIAEANVLPNSVVFLDDNPRERNAVASAIPEVRVINSSHYYWRRILLWSAETQSSAITIESSNRTEMIKGQIDRESEREKVPREDFLASLQLSAKFSIVKSKTDGLFNRALELLNKTNQFNTTGRRWMEDEFIDACTRGTVLTADVADRFTGYGLVIVCILSENSIEQLVMSCRVFGLELELAVAAVASDLILHRWSRIKAKIVETPKNILCRNLYRDLGWVQHKHGIWETSSANSVPAHISWNESYLQHWKSLQ